MARIALETPRLHIREVAPADAAAFLGYMQAEAYWQTVPIDPPTPDSIAAMVAARLAEQAADPRTAYFLAAADKQTGEVIGEAIQHIRSLRWRLGEIGWGVADNVLARGAWWSSAQYAILRTEWRGGEAAG